MGGLNWNYERLKAHIKEAGILAWRTVKGIIALAIAVLLIFCELVTTLAEALGLAVKKLIYMIFKPVFGDEEAEEA